MKKHSRTYEQYCWVMEKNIVFEETTFHNGTQVVRCSRFGDCTKNGGCKNRSLLPVFDSKNAGND